MKFVIRIESEALQDIQSAIDWYEFQQEGLGKKFYATLENTFEMLKTNPFYQNRYSNIRCLPLHKFPFMVHFSIDEANDVVIIRAVFNTSLDPGKWKGRV
jgi:toxin ParE1/3/4